MKTVFFLFMCTTLVWFGCKKDQPTVEQPSPEPTVAEVPAAPPVKRTEVAKGEIREIILALKRVHFPFDVHTLTDTSRQALDEAAVRLRNNTHVDLYVDGHTDNRGTTEYNMSLGERRATTVTEYLKNSGVAASRLNVVSFGEEKPLASGSDDRSRAMNRRVDFRLMSGDIQFVLEEGDLVDDQGQPLE